MNNSFVNSLIVAVATLLAASLHSCKTPTVVDSRYATTDFKVQPLSTDLDGSYTLRAWGRGKNRGQAIEQARKNAVAAVIFDGVQSSQASSTTLKPLIFEPNARERYESYFNRFFADGGEYKRFSSLVDEKRTSRVKSSDKNVENWGCTVRVDRDALRRQLIDDDIIKP